jgi:hypothetical protein
MFSIQKKNFWSVENPFSGWQAGYAERVQHQRQFF